MATHKNLNQFIAGEDDSLKRLDFFLSERFSDISRSYMQKCIRDGRVMVNSRVSKSSCRLKAGDNVVIDFPPLKSVSISPRKIPLDILYEDKDFLVLNKQPRISVHPSVSNEDEPTLVHALLYHCKDSLSGIGGVLRPGIVHRLDKDTSGCLVVAKNDKAHVYFSRQFKDRKVKKTYIALVKGRVSPEAGTIESPIGRSYKSGKKMSVHTFSGRSATTHYKVIKYFNNCSLLEISIATGRTHQIRVHMSAIGHPVLGDATYGDRKINKVFLENFSLNRQFLHAKKLGLKDLSGKEREFNAPLPADLEKVLSLL